MIEDELTGKILQACFEVSNELGAGFLESVYEKALVIALADKGLKAESQVSLKVSFRDRAVGEFFADVLVEDKVLLELKAIQSLTKEHYSQIINYLNAAQIDVGLLINFGKAKIEYKRFYRKTEKSEQHKIQLKNVFDN